MAEFARKIVLWQRRHGRHGLPWQGVRDPYRIWLAEVMLQQTQVAAVIPYYERFLARFPDSAALAAASEDEVLKHWSGLGYYARGRNLRKAARQIEAGGGFPRTRDEILELPGIGPSTAAAIAVFAFGARAAILDGNVKRVLARCFGVEGEKRQWALAESLLPERGIEAYTQGLMDLGATVCTRANPACGRCPVAAGCVARREGRIGELPSPRKRKPLPLRRSNWFVVLRSNRVLLERRPEHGIWGGLWAFPETRPPSVAGKGEKLPVIEHGFSHFRLRAQPILCRAASARGSGWFAIAAAARAAVPAPVRSLLLDLAMSVKVRKSAPGIGQRDQDSLRWGKGWTTLTKGGRT